MRLWQHFASLLWIGGYAPVPVINRRFFLPAMLSLPQEKYTATKSFSLYRKVNPTDFYNNIPDASNFVDISFCKH